MNPSHLAPQYVRDIAPYQPGKPIAEVARELGLREEEVIKLASNENPLGVSPKVAAAIQKAIPELAMYPDGSGFELKQALSNKYGVAMNQIILGNGSNDIIDLAARCFMVSGQSAVVSQYAFGSYSLAIQSLGGTEIIVPAREFGHDLDAMLAAIRPDTRLMYVANPNNPTGTFIEADKIHAFLKRVPAEVLVMLDEAYVEYLPADIAANSVAWVKEFPNLIVSRTFSKAYGLAGLRVGYGIAHPDVIELFNHVRQPFNVNLLALTAALAALEDKEFLAQSYDMNRRGMAQLMEGFAQQGLEYIPSLGNFICVKVEEGMAVFQKLMKLGIIVRPIASYGLPEYVRITIGTEQQNKRVLSALKTVLAA